MRALGLCLVPALSSAASEISQCTDLDGRCAECLLATDPRPEWASKCVFLDGPSEAGHTCQPAKWWEKYGREHPGVRACDSCSACAPAPSPFPATGKPPISTWYAPPGVASGSKMPYSAPLLGNGDLGVALMGSAARAEYHVALNQFWGIQNYSYPLEPEPPFPRVMGVGQLDVVSDAIGNGSYKAEMDTGRAELRTAFDRIEVACAGQQLRSVAFVAPHSNELLLTLALDEHAVAAEECASLELVLGVSAIDGNAASPVAAGCAMDGDRSSCANAGQHSSGGLWASRLAATQSPFPVVAALALRLVGGDESAVSERLYSNSGCISNVTFRLAAGHNVTVALLLLTNLDQEDGKTPVGGMVDPDPVPAALNRILAATADTTVTATHLATRRSEHDDWWSSFWNRSSISLPTDGLTECFWFGSQYLLGSAARTGKVPPGLWGPWVTGNSAAWHGDYTLNYNFQATFYGADSSNHLDAAEAQFQPLLQQAATGRMNARYYNCSGLHFTGHIAPWGFYGSLGPAPYGDMRQHSDASFAAINFLSHWEYTRNVTWLRETAFPFVAEVAEWWECWLQRDTSSEVAKLSEDGYRWVDPSDCNNENCGSHNPSNFNPIISTTFIRRIFTVLGEMAAALGGAGAPEVPDAERLALWADIAAHMALPQRASWQDVSTVWTYAEIDGKPEVPGAGQNAINLYPIWPAELVSLSSPNASGADPADPKASLTLDTGVASVLQSGAYQQGNSFMEIFPAGVRVRAPGIIQHFREQLQTRMEPNFVVNEQGGGLEVLGATEAVNNCLLTSHEGFLRFFPVWPSDEPASFLSLRAKGAFLVDAAWDNVTRAVRSGVRIASEVGETCAVFSPWNGSDTAKRQGVHVSDTTTGSDVAVQWISPEVFQFDTVAGHEYVLSPPMLVLV